VVDKYADVYVSISPYQYAANNPIKIIDQGGKLLKDKEGNKIATSTGSYISRRIDGIKGTGGMYSADVQYEVITIYTDAGRPINALKEMSQEVYLYNIDQDTRLGRTDPSNIGAECNCHGLSFGGGLIIIEDVSENSIAINFILADDGYRNSSEEDASLILAYDNKFKIGGITHSVLKNNGLYSADHGEGLPDFDVGFAQAMGGDINSRKSYHKRLRGDNKIDRTRGKVSNGIRKLSKKDIDKIRKENNISTLQELIDTINCER